MSKIAFDEAAIALAEARMVLHCAHNLGIPASVLASLRAGEMVAVPRKLLTEAHACMRTCGWQLAPAAEQGTDDDGVLALAVADIEAQFGELLAAAQPRRDEGNGDG